MDAIDSLKILSLEEQRAFVRNSDTERTSDVLDGKDVEEDSWDFEGMVTAEKEVTSGIRGKLRRSSA